jgi:hypothetical protein
MVWGYPSSGGGGSSSMPMTMGSSPYEPTSLNQNYSQLMVSCLPRSCLFAPIDTTSKELYCHLTLFLQSGGDWRPAPQPKYFVSAESNSSLVVVAIAQAFAHFSRLRGWLFVLVSIKFPDFAPIFIFPVPAAQTERIWKPMPAYSPVSL